MSEKNILSFKNYVDSKIDEEKIIKERVTTTSLRADLRRLRQQVCHLSIQPDQASSGHFTETRAGQELMITLDAESCAGVATPTLLEHPR